MFKEIEEKIKEEKYQSAEEQLDKLIINEKISENEKKYICTRVLDLASGESSLAAPLFYSYLYCSLH